MNRPQAALAMLITTTFLAILCGLVWGVILRRLCKRANIPPLMKLVDTASRRRLFRELTEHSYEVVILIAGLVGMAMTGRVLLTFDVGLYLIPIYALALFTSFEPSFVSRQKTFFVIVWLFLAIRLVALVAALLFIS